MDESSESHETTVVLKKALDWELSLDSRDLRSHAWYHGSIPRQRAEEIVLKDGDFLIRDCASQPGNYVLSCRSNSSVLHFVINKILLQPDTVYERVQYQFEDDAYDTVPDLITFYVGSGKPISLASGARIHYPCNRSHPLSFYNNINAFGSQIMGSSPLNSPLLLNSGLRFNPYSQQQSNYNNTYRSAMSSPPRSKRETPPRLPSKKQRSQSLTPNVTTPQNSNKYCSGSDDVIENVECNEFEKKPNGDSTTIHRSVTSEKCNCADSSNDVIEFPNGFNRSGAEEKENSVETKTLLNKSKTNQNQPPSPPPKPIRTLLTSSNLNTNSMKRDHIKELQFEQQHHTLNRVSIYHASGSDSGNGSGDSTQSSAAGDLLHEIPTHHRGVIIKNPRFLTNSASSTTLKSFGDFDVVAAEQELAVMDIPIIKEISKFDLENFHTLLLPTVENKPLDSGALNTLRLILGESGPRIIAHHLTCIDIKLVLGDFENQSSKNPLENLSGIELLTLPQSRIYRSDLIERTQCLKLLVAITILTCQNDFERAETLNKWIQVAVETKTALGNLFGFCAIMLGLCMTEVQKLEQTWHILRQKFTDSAFTFEAKLRPTLKSMNDCTNPQAPNTTVPHLIPYILLKDRNIDDILLSTKETIATAITQQQSSLITSCISSWEQNADDFGISILFAHIDSARFFAKNLSLYHRNSHIVIQESNSRLDEMLRDAFRTEFHIKFLWGSKGSMVNANERHSKLEKVLGLMADKFCLTDQIGCAG